MSTKSLLQEKHHHAQTWLPKQSRRLPEYMTNQLKDGRFQSTVSLNIGPDEYKHFEGAPESKKKTAEQSAAVAALAHYSSEHKTLDLEMTQKYKLIYLHSSSEGTLTLHLGAHHIHVPESCDMETLFAIVSFAALHEDFKLIIHDQQNLLCPRDQKSLLSYLRKFNDVWYTTSDQELLCALDIVR